MHNNQNVHYLYIKMEWSSSLKTCDTLRLIPITNSLGPGDTMRYRTHSTLVQVMAGCLLCIEPLPQLILTYHRNPYEQNSVKNMNINVNHIQSQYLLNICCMLGAFLVIPNRWKGHADNPTLKIYRLNCAEFQDSTAVFYHKWKRSTNIHA